MTLEEHPLGGFSCPECGDLAWGTTELIEAVAEFSWPDGDDPPDYLGYTEILWDTQETLTTAQGDVMLVCQAGHKWAGPSGWQPGERAVQQSLPNWDVNKLPNPTRTVTLERM